MELTTANSTREAKMKMVLVMNQMSMNLTYWTLDTLSLMFLWRLMKVSQLAVPRVVLPEDTDPVRPELQFSLPGMAEGSSQNETQLMATRRELGT